MKKQNLLASVLFILAGVSAGVGLNFLPINTVVQGAPGDPNPALKSVAHDATLTGDGTESKLLGIATGGVATRHLANSAVTPLKLDTPALPDAGQVLGFNGANLEWQNPAAGGVRVVDSHDQLVGPLIIDPNAGNETYILRLVHTFTFLIPVRANGFPNRNFFPLYHTNSNCSDSRYFYDDGTGLWRNSATLGSKVFYAADPLQQITVNSYEQFTPNSDPNQAAPCHVLDPPLSLPLGIATTFDLSTLEFMPPFRLEF